MRPAQDPPSSPGGGQARHPVKDESLAVSWSGRGCRWARLPLRGTSQTEAGAARRAQGSVPGPRSWGTCCPAPRGSSGSSPVWPHAHPQEARGRGVALGDPSPVAVGPGALLYERTPFRPGVLGPRARMPQRWPPRRGPWEKGCLPLPRLR